MFVLVCVVTSRSLNRRKSVAEVVYSHLSFTFSHI